MLVMLTSSSMNIGKLDDGTCKFLQVLIYAFANWVETIRYQGQLV
jgi:hypothetical protein